MFSKVISLSLCCPDVPFASFIISRSFSFLTPIDPRMGIVCTGMTEVSYQKGKESAGSQSMVIEQVAIH